MGASIFFNRHESDGQNSVAASGQAGDKVRKKFIIALFNVFKQNARTGQFYFLIMIYKFYL
jgi:hypothetical protein